MIDRAQSPSVAIALVVALSMSIAASAPAEQPEPGVTDFLRVDPTKIKADDITEALAVPRGTTIGPASRPKLRLPIYFESNSVQPSQEALELLEQVSLSLSSSDLQGTTFALEGHTDAIGDASYNERLSRARAEAVQAFLAERGVSAERLQPLGKGEAHPVAPNDQPAGRKLNRRVVIINLNAQP